MAAPHALTRRPSTGHPGSWRCRLAAWLLILAAAAGCSSLPAQVDRPPSASWPAPQETPLGQLTAARRTQAATRATSGFALLDSVDTAYAARLSLVEQARRTLDVQSYAIHADGSTAALLERIKAAAGRGVRVRVLLDDFNSVGDDAQVLRLALVPGVEMRLFNPLAGSRGSMVGKLLGSLHQGERIARRMHNKLFLADSAWVITGGRNIGDAYFGGDAHSAFVDLDVLAAGAVVRDMAASFDRYWNDPLAYPALSLLSPDELQSLRAPPSPAAPQDPRNLPVLLGVPPQRQADAAARAPLDLARVSLAWAPALLMADQPGKLAAEEDDNGDTTVDGLLALMRGAQQDVLVVSPYFVPGAQMMEVLAELRRRGVSVRVLTNSLASTDAPAAHAGYRRFRPALIDMGVELHELRADPTTAGLGGGSGVGAGSSRSAGSGFGLGSTTGGSKSGASRASLHAKAVVIDRRLAVIGSMNLDLRSQLKNSEVALVIRSPALARQVVGLVEASFSRGTWRLERGPGGALRWRAPTGAGFADAVDEPDTPWALRALVKLLGPLAPDEML